MSKNTDLSKEAVMKRASGYLKKLAEEVKDFRQTEDKRKLVETIIEKTPGSLSGTEFLSKYSSLMDNDIHDLEVTSEAMDLAKEGTISLGTVSKEKLDKEQYDALTRVLLEEEI